MSRLIKITRDFPYGWVNKVGEDKIRKGASSNNNNFSTNGDRVELRRGYKLLGTEVIGTGRISGLGIAERTDGNDQMWITFGKKIKYYDRDTEDFVEVGSDQLGDDADGEDFIFAAYQSLAGYQIWGSSPNSSLYKIMVSNPANITDMYDSSKNFKGLITIKQNRTFLWNTNDKDKTGVNGSNIDKQQYDSYDEILSEVIGTGDASEKTFSNTLVFKAAGAKRTCFLTVVTDGTETFNDNFDGTLTGTLGGTGTINYTTGVISVTFNTAPANAQDVTCNYYWEDSTDAGIADFTESGTRVAGEGFVFRQDDGGAIQSILALEDIEYCMHSKKTWTLYLTDDDTNAENRIFRERVGIPYFLAAVASGDGIYYVDNKDDQVRIRLLAYSSSNDKVVPVEKSIQLDLSGYNFDQADGIEFGDYVLIACKTSDSSHNNTVLAYNKIWNSWDKWDYWVSRFGIYDGALIAGDSISNNIYELLSGLDDDDSTIIGHWDSWEDDLDYDGLKKYKKFIVEGNIGVNQITKVDMNYDNSGWVEVGEVRGDGSYVDKGQSVAVGATTLGKKEIGGGGSGINAYHYRCPITVNSDRFYKVKFRFRTTGIGWFDFKNVEYFDVRMKQKTIPVKYR